MIILVFVFLYVLRYQSIVFNPERVVPPELEPIDNYIGDCLGQTSREAIDIIGINGGYIEFPEEIEKNPLSYISTNPLFKKDIKMPLWKYRGVENVPSEEFITSQIESYVDEHMIECLEGMQAFSTLFEIKSLRDNPKSEVELLSQGVKVELDYPLEIKTISSNQVSKLEGFRIIVPKRLKTVYELAKKVAESEINDKFFELKTIDLVAMDVDIPYTEVVFDCNPRRWKVKDVKDKIKKLLTVNVPNVKVDGTDHQPIPEEYEYMQNHYVWKGVVESRYPDTKVSFTYDPEWSTEIFIFPNEGEYLVANPSRSFDMLSFLCMNMWHFTYDIRYPVMVTVKDDAKGGYESYTFNFGFEVGVNHNRPDNSNFNIQKFEFEQKGSLDFCEDMPKNVLTVHTFENISKNGEDRYIELPGVKLDFMCIDKICPVKESEIMFRGADVFSTSEVPYCNNGIIVGEKEGYESSKAFVSTAYDNEADIYLRPIIYKNFSVIKHDIVNGVVYEPEKLDNLSSVMVRIKHEDFVSNGYYPIDSIDTEIEDMDSMNALLYDAGAGEMSQIKMLAKEDYMYNVDIYLVDDQDNFIGGYKGNWSVSWDDLKDGEEVVFHVIQMPFTRDEEKQVEFLINLKDSSKGVQNPEIK